MCAVRFSLGLKDCTLIDFQSQIGSILFATRPWLYLADLVARSCTCKMHRILVKNILAI